MTCDEIDELAGAIALDAIPDMFKTTVNVTSQMASAAPGGGT